MSEEKTYEVPEVLPGDLIECLKTGGQGIIREENGRNSFSVHPLPGAGIRCAWWDREDFKVVEKGPAHKGWAAGLMLQKAKDGVRDKHRNIDWVIANWETCKLNVDSDMATSILKAAGLFPDQAGFMSRGEIGLMALEVYDIYRCHRVELEAAMTFDDPKAELRTIGKVVMALRCDS